MTEFPRTLVLSMDLPHSGGSGPLVLMRLLANWPADRLLAAGPRVPDEAVSLSCRYVELRPPLWRLDNSRLARWSRLLTLSGFRAALSRTCPGLMSFEPEIVLMVMQNLGYSDLAYRFSRECDVPLAVLVHDDPDDFERTFRWMRPLVGSRNAEIYRHAAARFCVSPEMETVLGARYGAAGEVLYPVRSSEVVPRPVSQSQALKAPGWLTLGHAGTLRYGYGERLRQLAPALRSANARVRLYSPDPPGSPMPEGLTYAGAFPTPEDAWKAVQRECDAVVLPYCYEEHGHQEVYRTHFPSKLTEYLGLGMPVVVGGPEHATGVSWGLRHEAACMVVTDQETGAWVRALTLLRSDGDMRRRLAEGALEAAARDFDPVRTRARFERRLLEIASR